jgi:hypothetical protein
MMLTVEERQARKDERLRERNEIKASMPDVFVDLPIMGSASTERIGVEMRAGSPSIHLHLGEMTETVWPPRELRDFAELIRGLVGRYNALVREANEVVESIPPLEPLKEIKS